MPRRQTQQLRGPKDQSFKKQPPKKKKSGRSLNALAIAEAQLPQKPGVRRTRLGEEDDQFKRKRHSAHEQDDSDGPDNKRARFGDDGPEDDENGGSDGEGHRWRIGEVESDDDSDLDSDEALGSSDEERFEGYTFRGSSKPKQKSAKSGKSSRKLDLSEDVEDSEEEDEEEDDDDDLGEDAVDLTTAWDMNTAAEEEDARKAAAKTQKQADGDDYGDDDDDDESGSDDASESNDDDELSISGDEADSNNAQGLAKLQSFVNSMETEPATKSTRKTGGGQEHVAPTEYGLTNSKKLTVADLMPSITDSNLKNSLKHVDSTPSAHKSTSGIPGKLDAPLARRQQDRLDRAAAYEKSKETLDRWLETVKHNRRAEHLVFPLPDPEGNQTHRLGAAKPQTDLENAVQNILAESGLTENKGKSAEEQVQEFEELQARKLPIEEIRARRAELRKRRDLMFREEVRAKRIKKIKSKSYRRVHRKERERMDQKERQALIDAGVDPDEEDREKYERRRAEARMGSKHKDSKWAKSLRQTGRTAWDEEARHGATDLAMKEEELRKRIEGKRVTNGDEDYLGSSSSESDDEDPWDEEGGSDREKRKLREKIGKLEGDDENAEEPTGPHAKLLSMKFMKNAEASRKAQNDAELRQLNRELHGEDSPSEAESEVGRRKFGQSEKKSAQNQKPKPAVRNEFEEAPGSDEEPEEAAQPTQAAATKPKGPAKQTPGRPENKSRARRSEPAEQDEAPAEEENPWLVQTNRNNRRPVVEDSQPSVDITVDGGLPDRAASKEVAVSKKQKPSTNARKQQPEEAHDSDDDDVPVLLKNHDLVKRAFAGDEVVQDFEQEKMDTVKEEDDQVIDNTLPGWGSWGGEGISKKQKQRQKRFTNKVEGVKPEDRKDAKLSRVIINEKRVKKNNKYLASTLPHQFETKQQYERSLRLPIGPEWSTKETFQDATQPRVLMKQGVIKPMEKPMY